MTTREMVKRSSERSIIDDGDTETRRPEQKQRLQQSRQKTKKKKEKSIVHTNIIIIDMDNMVPRVESTDINGKKMNTESRNELI